MSIVQLVPAGSLVHSKEGSRGVEGGKGGAGGLSQQTVY